MTTQSLPTASTLAYLKQALEELLQVHFGELPSETEAAQFLNDHFKAVVDRAQVLEFEFLTKLELNKCGIKDIMCERVYNEINAK